MSMVVVIDSVVIDVSTIKNQPLAMVWQLHTHNATEYNKLIAM